MEWPVEEAIKVGAVQEATCLGKGIFCTFYCNNAQIFCEWNPGELSSLCSGGCKGRDFDPLLRQLSSGSGRDHIILLEPSIVKRKLLVELGKGPKNNCKMLS